MCRRDAKRNALFGMLHFFSQFSYGWATYRGLWRRKGALRGLERGFLRCGLDDEKGLH